VTTPVLIFSSMRDLLSVMKLHVKLTAFHSRAFFPGADVYSRKVGSNMSLRILDKYLWNVHLKDKTNFSVHEVWCCAEM
jgi:hypothetical protein